MSRRRAPTTRKRKPATLADSRVHSAKALAFGRWLNRRRDVLDVTLRDISYRVGIALGTLSELERGYSDPLELSIRTLHRLSIGYRVQITALLTRMGLIPYDAAATVTGPPTTPTAPPAGD